MRASRCDARWRDADPRQDQKTAFGTRRSGGFACAPRSTNRCACRAGRDAEARTTSKRAPIGRPLAVIKYLRCSPTGWL